MVGAPFAAVLSDRFGRRRGMFAGGFVIIIGMIIAATAQGVPQLVVGRFVLGVGISIMTVAAPAVSLQVSRGLRSLMVSTRSRLLLRIGEGGARVCVWFTPVLQSAGLIAPGADSRVLQLRMVRWKHSRRGRHVRLQLYRLESVVADPPYPAGVRVRHRHDCGLLHTRISPLPDGQRPGGRGNRLPSPLSR